MPGQVKIIIFTYRLSEDNVVRVEGQRANTTVAWPRVTTEERRWRRDAQLRDVVSRARFEAIATTYQAAVLPAIAGITPELGPALRSEVEAATAALHRFDAEVGREIAPFSAVLLRTESASSSQIERITASARAIARAELGDESRANATAVVANTRAMEAAVRLSDTVDLPAMLTMHRELMGSQAPQHAGRVRSEQVWIGGDSLSPGGAEFIPPHHEHLEAALTDLVEFIARTDIPALAHAALAHAQFETIHPFVDGNGRTGRALVHSMLRAARVSRHVSVPISAGLLAEVDRYFHALGSYRDGDAGPIIACFVDASYRAVENGRRLVGELEAIESGWRERLRLRADARAWDVVKLLLRHPAGDAALLERELGLIPTNVARTVAPLLEAGVLQRFGGTRTGVVYEAPEVLDALDAFAGRAGLRRVRGG